jgi:hypothetical protein
MAATIGHFLLTASWMRRLAPEPRSHDERWFQATLAGVATLSLVIHLVSLTSGLTLARGLGALAVWHLGLAAALGLPWLGASGGRAIDPAGQTVPAGRPRVEGLLEACAGVVLAGIALAWVLDASGAIGVSGTDAAHYHVPVAVNLSLGARLTDLPATQHLYPMGASALVAWFILPTGGPLLIDLAMLLPFALLAASVAWIFRLATGASGLAWTTWWLLALFAMPLFRSAGRVSADLLFAASCAAFLAQIVALSVGRTVRTIDVLLAGLAAGLLVGSKTTGIAAAALLIMFGLAALPFVRRFVSGDAKDPGLRALAWSVPAAVVLGLGAGGLWLVRNWWLFGSPLAPSGLSLLGIEIFPGVPIEPTLRDSVLRDQLKPDYALARRLAHYTARWLGPWYLVLLLPAAAVPLDALWSRLRRVQDPTRPARLLVWALVMATGVTLGWLLIGAPWTSLERSGGLSLRYMLPFAALLPCLAAIGLFPSSAPWYRRPLVPAIAGLAAVMAGVVLLWLGQGRGLAPPRLEPAALGVSLAGWILASVAVRRVPARFAGARGAAAWTVGVVVLSAAWALQSEARGSAVRVAAERREARADRRPEPARALYLAALDWERESDLECRSRRFFAIVRFNLPLELQSLDYRNQVFYAGRDVALTARASPMTTCDYLIASRGLLASGKGRALVNVLNPTEQPVEIAERGSFVLIGRRRGF